jgi:hypothetical protein
MRFGASLLLFALVPSCTLATPYPDATAEICDNHVDDDLNTRIDCDDPACNGAPTCSPQIPWLAAGAPAIAPPDATCTTGWNAVVGADGVTTCDPYPASGPATCVTGFAHFPGDPACAPIGRACPTGDFPDDLPSAGVVYVRAGQGDGDGSRAHPYSSITLALERTGPIVLAPGTYVVPSGTTIGRSIRGACAARTTLTAMPTSAQQPATLLVGTMGGTTTVLEDLTVAGVGTDAAVQALGPIVLRGVVLSGGGQAGIVGGPLVSGSGSLELDEVVIQHVGPDGNGLGGYGVDVTTGLDVRLHRVIVEDVRAIGIAVVQAGHGSLVMSDVVVRDVAPEMATNASGAGVISDVPTTIVSLLAERTVGVGLSIQAPATLSNVVVRDVAVGADASLAVAIDVPRAASFDADHVSIAGASLAGLRIVDVASAHLRDVVVRSTAPAGGGGVLVANTTLSMDRAWIDGASVGLLATGGSFVSLSNARVGGAASAGIVAGSASELDGAHLLVEANALAGIVFGGLATSGSLEDVAIRTTGDDAHAATGLAIEDGADVDVERVAVTQSSSIGLRVTGDRSRLVASDLLVRGAARPACADRCGGGVGVIALAGASIVASRFGVDTAAVCGAQLDATTHLETHGCEIDRAPAGACVSSSGVVSTTAFRFGGAGPAISITSLPVPDAIVVPELP